MSIINHCFSNTVDFVYRSVAQVNLSHNFFTFKKIIALYALLSILKYIN